MNEEQRPLFGEVDGIVNALESARKIYQEEKKKAHAALDRAVDKITELDKLLAATDKALEEAKKIYAEEASKRIGEEYVPEPDPPEDGEGL